MTVGREQCAPCRRPFCVYAGVVLFPMYMKKDSHPARSWRWGKTMTKEQQSRLRELRSQGYGYATIANAVGLSKDAVRSFCRSHNLAGTKSESNTRIELPALICRQCGKEIIQTPGKKKMKFCSAECRQKWWNSHPEAVRRKAVYSFSCACCGKGFTAYGNSHRKYCSHGCYISDRFKGGAAI